MVMLKREDMLMNIDNLPKEVTLADLLQSSQKFQVALNDLNRLQKYMTPSEKERVVELVKIALGKEAR